MKMSVMPPGGQANVPPHERTLAPAGPWAAAAWESLALLGILALAFGLRTEFLGIRPAWVGGAFSLDAVRKAVSDMMTFLQSGHPLADYPPLLAVGIRGGIRWVEFRVAPTRELSLLSGLAAVFLTWQIGKRLFSAPIGIVAAALVALSPFQMIASSQIRMDMPLECLVLASTLILWRALDWPPSLWLWAGYGAGVALMARTNPYTLLLLPAHALWVFFRRPFSQAIEHLLLAGAVALALYLSWAPHVLALPDTSILWRQPVHLDYILAVVAAQAFGGYPFNGGPYGAVGRGLGPAYDLFLVLPFLGLMAAGALAVGRIDRGARMLVWLSWTVPVVLIALVASALGSLADYPGHILFIQPFAALLLAAGILRLRQGARAAPQANGVTA